MPEHIHFKMEQSEKILNGYSDHEKGAYLGAIASIATADRSATEEEIEHLKSLAEAADLSTEQEAAVVRAATELSGDELKKCLDVLKNSDLKFSLVADIITFAKVDKNYSAEEKTNVEKIAQYLEVNHNQFSLLDQFVNKTTKQEINKNPEEVRNPGFFESLGFKDKFQKACIDVNSLSRGLLSIVCPMILANMVTGGMRRRSGFNTQFGQNRQPIPSGGGFGDLGSLFSILNSGKGYRGMGSILPKLFR